MSISAGESDKAIALAEMLGLAESARADAWEPAGPGSFRLLKRYRSSD